MLATRDWRKSRRNSPAGWTRLPEKQQYPEFGGPSPRVCPSLLAACWPGHPLDSRLTPLSARDQTPETDGSDVLPQEVPQTAESLLALGRAGPTRWMLLARFRSGALPSPFDPK